MKNFAQKSLNLFKNYWPIFLMIFLVFVFFWKFFLKGLIPIPGDFVVGVYYPWLDYKWGLPAGVPVKNPILADVPSFIYPMQTFAIDVLKDGKLPLWNPLILAGTPLLANFQSAPFSVVNFVYFLFEKTTAWSIQIILQHILAAIFTYLLLRWWKVSKTGSILGGIVFAFSGYNLIWSQWNGHVLSAALIPLSLLFCDRWFLKRRFLDGLGISVSIFLIFLSGYPQSIIYLGVAIFLLWIVRVGKLKRRISGTLFLGTFIFLGIGLAFFQILPGWELLSLSQRGSELHPFEWAFLPWSKIITFLAPDFFGNHATGNYWGPQDYTSNTGFVGVVAFTLSVISLFMIKKRKEIYFAVLLAIFSLILAFPTPLSIFLWKSGFLGLNAASAHRSLVIWNLSVAILAGFGIDNFKQKFGNKVLALAFPFIILSGFAIYAFQLHEPVGLRNLILPSMILFGFIVVILAVPKFKYVLLVLSFFEIFYFGWKFTPFSPRSFVFPETPVLKFLEVQSKPYRVVADKVIPINLLMNYKIETLEGYDAVYPKSISEFISKINGNYGATNSIRRYGIIDNYNSDLLDLANVRYLVVKKENLNDYLKYKKFRAVFDDKSVVVLENLDVYPRAFMIYDGKPDNKFKFSKVEYSQNNSNQTTIKIKTEMAGLLLVSDSFYPGWRAYIDGKETEINKENYVFRGVSAPVGEHEVKFIYRPGSFDIGLTISSISLLSLLSLIGYTSLKYRKKHAKS